MANKLQKEAQKGADVAMNQAKEVEKSAAAALSHASEQEAQIRKQADMLKRAQAKNITAAVAEIAEKLAEESTTRSDAAVETLRDEERDEAAGLADALTKKHRMEVKANIAMQKARNEAAQAKRE